MATATISSMLLSSDDPKRLARWYATAFEGEIQTDPDAPGYEILELDGFYIMFDKRDDVSGPNVGGARAILNVEVDDPVATAARIDELGAEWVSPLEDKGGGSYFGTVTDPDGNWLQIVRISDELEAQMSTPTSPYSGFAVRDLAEAEAFYRGVLGMRVLRFEMGAGSAASGPDVAGAGSAASGPDVAGAGSAASGPDVVGAGSAASGPDVVGAGSAASGPDVVGAGSAASGPDVAGAPMTILGIRINRNTTVLVYPKPDHEPANFTILNIPARDLEQMVDDLAGKGVEFLRYDDFEQDGRGIARGDGRGPDIAWFADPSGNIVAVHQK